MILGGLGKDDLCSLLILVVGGLDGNDDLCSLSICWRMLDGVRGMKVSSVVCEGAGGLLVIEGVEVLAFKESFVDDICSLSDC